jgi:cytochrome c-type biogenesis protein CcmH
MRHVRRLLAGLALLAALAPAALAAEPRASLPDIEDEVMCPVCGVALNIAQAPQADRQRAFIRDLIARGQTKEQIKSALKREFGPAVLAVPDDEGFDLAAYLVPIAAALALLAALGVTLVRWRRPGAAPGGPGTTAVPSASPADRRRLEDDLARYDL